MRFYEPQRGQILFDGVPITQIDLRELRSRISLVLQDVFLFSRSVEYNIRLGNQQIADARVQNAARRVGAQRFIEQLPEQYHDAAGRARRIAVRGRTAAPFLCPRACVRSAGPRAR